MEKDLITYFERDSFAKHLGIEVLEFKAGYARVKMKVEDFHLNGVGLGHGGAIFSVADFAFAIASNSYGTVSLAINVAIAYFRAVHKGTVLVAEAEEVSLNPKLATYEVKVLEEKGDIVALFQGTVYRKKQDLAEAVKSFK